MKTAHLWRHDFGDQGTLGLLFVYGETGGLLDYFLTGEDPWLDNKGYVSCLPPGPNSGAVTYLCKWVSTGKHPSGIYMLQNTGDRVACEIHSGNFFGNIAKGLKSNVEGCIMVGRQTGLIGGQLAIEVSSQALDDFNALMNKEDFNLVIHGAVI